MQIQILMSKYLSIHHAKSAAHFSRLAASIENDENQLARSEIATHVGASILSAVAFLEATINELFAESERDSNAWLANVTDKSKKLIKTLSEIDAIDRSNILDKYDIFLVSAGFEPISRGCPESQNVKALITLRNNITHYKASWLDSGSKELMRKGSSHKGNYWIELNQLIFGKNHNHKAHTWEQSEYAEWACKSSFEFVEAVFKVLGSPSNINHVQEDLLLR